LIFERREGAVGNAVPLCRDRFFDHSAGTERRVYTTVVHLIPTVIMIDVNRINGGPNG